MFKRLFCKHRWEFTNFQRLGNPKKVSSLTTKVNFVCSECSAKDWFYMLLWPPKAMIDYFVEIKEKRSFEKMKQELEKDLEQQLEIDALQKRDNR